MADSVTQEDMRPGQGASGELTIYTLLMIVRGLSNEITVRGLANSLGISYSTLARCKNGVWPRSVTLDAMRGVLDDCRIRFFDGDGEALANSMLLQLRGQEIETSGLEQTMQREGYDAFISELMLYAQRREAPRKAEVEAEPAPTDLPSPPRPTDAVSPALPSAEQTQAHAQPQTQAHAQPQRPNDLLLALPVLAILLVGLFNVSLSAIFTWASENRLTFVAISLLIAASPVLVGILVDAPLAWLAYRKSNPGTTFTFAAYSHVAKYGDTNGVMPGAGRFDLTPQHIVYQLLCNFLGMMCYVALLDYLLALPGFSSFFADHEWAEFFKAGIAVGFLIAFGNLRDQSLRPRVTNDQNAYAENPDNYLLSRASVWANTVHLVWTNSLLIVLLLSLIAYGIVEFRTIETPMLVLWPYAQGMLFFAYSCVSPTAIRLRATCVGIFVPGVVVTSVGFAILTTTCFLPSWAGVALCLTCAACTTGAFVWTRRYQRNEADDWLTSATGSRAYSIVMAASIFVLLCVGLATSAFI